DSLSVEQDISWICLDLKSAYHMAIFIEILCPCQHLILFDETAPLQLITIVADTDHLEARRFCKSRSAGTDSTHGGHQVPQKSSSTTFPFRSSSEMYSPSAVVIEKSGAKASRARRGFSISFAALSAWEPFGSTSIYFFSSAAPSASRPNSIKVKPRL